MIDSILTIVPSIARDIPQYDIVHVWDEELSASRLVMCKGHTDNWSVFAYDNGYTFRVPSHQVMRVIVKVTAWENLSPDELMDIELDLMIRGA